MINGRGLHSNGLEFVDETRRKGWLIFQIFTFISSKFENQVRLFLNSRSEADFSNQNQRKPKGILGKSVMRLPSLSNPLFLFIFPGLSFSSISCSKKLAYNLLCPLNFDILWRMTKSFQNQVTSLDIETECHLIFVGTRVVHSEYLRATGYFSLSPSISEDFWDSF